MTSNERGGHTYVADSLAGLGAVAGYQVGCNAFHPERAARLFGAAERLRMSAGPSFYLSGAARERAIATVRAQMDDAAWLLAWENGHAMAIDEAISLALADPAFTDHR